MNKRTIAERRNRYPLSSLTSDGKGDSFDTHHYAKYNNCDFAWISHNNVEISHGFRL